MLVVFLSVLETDVNRKRVFLH